MKHQICCLLLVLSSFIVFSQIDEEKSILTDSNWNKEIIEFPVDWAPKVDLNGFEELRFSPYWSNPKSDQFWSLIMAWNVKRKKPLTVKEIEQNFEGYFEGLMIPNHWKTTFPRPNALFLSKGGNTTNITGKMKLFDGFHTGKMIELNIAVSQYFNKKEGKSTLLFRISPKSFDNAIWKLLRSIKRKP